MKARLVNAKLIRETEKAALVEVRLGDEDKKQVWFPKSHIEITSEAITISGWIYDQKNAELENHQANIAADLIYTAEEIAAVKTAAQKIKVRKAAW